MRKKMGKFAKASIEKRKEKRRKQAARNMPTGDQAIQNALDKGFITMDQVKEYWELEHKKRVAAEALKKSEKFKRKARIINGLNTNSM
jgi:hypothetical protein